MSSAAAVTPSAGMMSAGTIVLNKKSNRQKIKLGFDVTFTDIFPSFILLCSGQFSGCCIDRILRCSACFSQKGRRAEGSFQQRIVIHDPHRAGGMSKRLPQPL